MKRLEGSCLRFSRRIDDYPPNLGGNSERIREGRNIIGLIFRDKEIETIYIYIRYTRYEQDEKAFAQT